MDGNKYLRTVGGYHKKGHIPRFFLLLVTVLVLVLLSCASQPQAKQPPDEVTLQLKWLHQAQFAGFYMAQDNGYYAQENINVNFLEGGEGVDPVLRVISGEADFGVVSPENILMKRTHGASLVAIAAIYQRSAVVFVARANSGIVRPSDFIGKTVATASIGGSIIDIETQFRAMMKQLGLDVSQVTIIPYDFDYTAFYNGQAEVTGAYYTGDLIRMRQNGLGLNLIWPSDYGIHFYSDTLATTEKLIAENPDLVSRFIRASLRGWQDAIEDYEQAAAITLKYAQPPDLQLQIAMMETMLPLVNTGEDYIGWMKPERWQGMYDMLLEQGLLPNPFDVNQAYTLQFLGEIYGAETK